MAIPHLPHLPMGKITGELPAPPSGARERGAAATLRRLAGSHQGVAGDG